jgi:hypothetical protein
VSGHLDGQHAATDDAIVTVHVRLLDEGTEVWRPTMAERLPDGTYRLAPTPEYDVTTETWEFPPGTIVVCSQHRLAEGTVLGADALAPSAPPAAYDLPSRQR